MYPGTEDLLKIRDREPVDAKVRATVEADPKLQAEIERLRRTRDLLQALPTFEPPPRAWDRVAEASGAHLGSGWRWPLRGAIAASVAVMALLLVMRAPQAPEAPLPSTIVAEMPEAGTGGGLDRRLATPTYASLIAESAQLERQLNEIDYRPRLINAGTATTIAGLEDQIALIDGQLMYSRGGLQPRQTEALLQMRVDLMNALLKVRYAQAQRSGF